MEKKFWKTIGPKKTKFTFFSETNLIANNNCTVVFNLLKSGQRVFMLGRTPVNWTKIDFSWEKFLNYLFFSTQISKNFRFLFSMDARRL